MIAPLPPLDAYRADLAAAPSLAAFGDDATWLQLAELVSRRGRDSARAGDAGGPAWPAFLAALGRVLALPAAAGGDAEADVLDALARTAEAIEEAGALRLAYTLLADAERAWRELPPRRRGLLIAQRARVARKLGEAEASDFLYRAAARIGRATADADLVARAQLGRAVLARRRGNYPESRRRYRLGLRAARRGGARELEGVAHHGLAILAGKAHEFDAALVHGWKALRRAGDDPTRRAELLASLAAAASDAGHHRPALHAYLAAVDRSAAGRVRLPALGGAAVCAAALGEGPQLLAITDALEGELARVGLPYEQAQALLLLARAWTSREPDGRAAEYRARAAALAAAHGFHELAHEADALRAATARAEPSARGAAARRVLGAMEHVGRGETATRVLAAAG